MEDIRSYTKPGLERLLSSRYDSFLIVNQKDEVIFLPDLYSNRCNFLKGLKLGDKIRIETSNTPQVERKSISQEVSLSEEGCLQFHKFTLNGILVEHFDLEVGALNELLQFGELKETYYYLVFSNKANEKPAQFKFEEVQKLLDFLNIKNGMGSEEDGKLTIYPSKKFKNYYSGSADESFFSYIHTEDQGQLKSFLKGKPKSQRDSSLILRLQFSKKAYHYAILRCIFHSNGNTASVVILVSDIDTKLKEGIHGGYDFFYFSDVSQNILVKGERNFTGIENKYGWGSRKLSELGLSENDSKRIAASYQECFEQGISTCKVAIKSDDNQASEQYKLKQYKISDGNVHTLGVMSLFQSVNPHEKLYAEQSGAEPSGAEPSGAELSGAESSNMEVSVLRNMFDLMSDCIVLANLNGKISYINKVGRNLLYDIQPSSKEQAFANIFNLLNVDDLLKAHAESRYDFQKSEKIVFERANANKIALQCESKLLQTDTSTTLLCFVIKDITQLSVSEIGLQNELKILQETYQQMLEQNIMQQGQKMLINEEFEEAFFERNILDTFFNSNNTASIILDRHLNVKYFNSKANSLVMLLNGIYLDKRHHISNYHLPCNHARFEKYAKKALKGYSLKMLSNTSIRKKYKLRTYEIVFIPLTNESNTEPDYLACNFTDVSDLQERQNQLDLFENVVEYAKEGIIVTKANPLHDPGPEIIYVNHAMEKISGYLASELIGENPRILQGSKTDRNALNRIKQSLIKGKPIKEELINYTKEGRLYWVELSITPIFDRLGNVSCFVSHQKDITARKDNEIERSTMIKHLLRQNQELDEFAFITSHNLRAPVARLLGLTDLIGYELDENRLPKELFKHVETSANLLDEIIRDLNYILAFKKHIGEKQEVIHFEEKADKIKIALSKQIEASKTEIICDFKDCPTVYSIDSYVGNIMENLIHNAIKYARKDVAPRIEVKSMYKDMAPCIQIVDNGMGFPENVSDRDFMLYRSFHPEIPGKGLGLFLVKSHVEMLRGSLRLESKENEGSIFTIVFPPESEQPLNTQ